MYLFIKMKGKLTKRTKPFTVSKRQKKVMTLQQKIEVLDSLKKGESATSVGRKYGLNESTIRSIKNKEADIRKFASKSYLNAAKYVSIKRDPYIVKMESALSVWIDDCRKKNIHLQGNVIREKASDLYKKLVEEDKDDPQPGTSKTSDAKFFQASRGWLERFLGRYNLKNGRLHSEAAFADPEAAEVYRVSFRNMIEKKRYRPEQVFNMAETELYWKKMPPRTYLMKEEAKNPGFKTQNDKITLIMCGNAAGFLLKPGLIYKSANPRALKNKNKNDLPVYWMHNPKPWITEVTTSDWFHRCFIPEVANYLVNLGLEFKVLLVINSSGGDSLSLSYDGVQIEVLPPNTVSLLQPMDQGVIRAFKTLYTCNTLQHLVNAMDVSQDLSLKEYWKAFTISSCLDIIESVLKDIKPETVNSCWKKLWPEVVQESCNGVSPEEIHNEAVTKSVTLAKLLGGEGFDDCTEEDVNTLADPFANTMTDSDLIELTISGSEEEGESGREEEEEEEEDEGLSIQRLGIILGTQQELQSYIEDWDPNVERALETINALNGVMETYKVLYTAMRRQQQQQQQSQPRYKKLT